MNKGLFFDTIRVDLFAGKLSTKQVEGIEAILDEWEKRKLTDLRRLAYILATVFHETAKTMQPIEEYGKGKGRKYGKKIKRSGVAYSVPDKIYYGRGWPQLTWYENYELMGRLTGRDLLNHPELMLVMEVSAEVTFEGMLKGASSFGDFTGKCLEMYFNDKTEDWVNARRIINGLDAADIIANYGKLFYNALKVT